MGPAYIQYCMNICLSQKCIPTQFVNCSKKGSYELESKQQSTVLYGCFEMSQIQQKLLAQEALPSKFYFFGKTGHVSIVPLEQRRTINPEWYETIRFPRNQENQLPKTNHFSPGQCELSHIGSNNCIFEHSKH